MTGSDVSPEPTLADLLAGARVFRVPLRIPFRGVLERVGVLFQGPAGWAEFAPFAEYDEREASWWLDAAVEAAYLPWPTPQRDMVGVNAIVPACTPTQAESLALAAIDQGCRTVKIKVAAAGGSLAADADRVAAVAGVFDGALRVDANGGWDVDQAVAALTVLDRVARGLQYVEQPCRELTDLAQVRSRCRVPVAADESIRRAADPQAAARAGAADILVVKPAPLGGVRRALTVVAETGLPVVVSSAMDTSIGLASAVALAAALPSLEFDCGMGTAALLAADVVRPSTAPEAGNIKIGPRPEPAPDLLAAAVSRVSDSERDSWLERVEAAWQAGTQVRLSALLADSSL